MPTFFSYTPSSLTLLSNLSTPLGLIEATAENQTLFEECCCVVADCLCGCAPIQAKWDAVLPLFADIDYPAGCGTDETLTLIHSGATAGTVPAGMEDCPQWGNRLTVSAFGTFDISVWCDGSTLNAIIVQVTLGAAPCKFGDEGVAILPVSIICEGDAYVIIFELDVIDNGGMIPCPCPGTTMRVVITNALLDENGDPIRDEGGEIILA